jgi:hypothetical protein
MFRSATVLALAILPAAVRAHEITEVHVHTDSPGWPIAVAALGAVGVAILAARRLIAARR